MIDEVKKIKLEELNNQKLQYEEDYTMQNLHEIRNNLHELELEQSQGLTVRSNFSFLERWFTKRNDYKKFKAQFKRLSKLPKLIEELKREEEKAEQELETSGINMRIIEVEQKIRLLEDAKTLYEIGITPIEAMELLESKGIQPVLSESDKSVFSHPRNYSSKSSLIGVHKTKYAPTANMIKTAKDSNVEYTENIILNGIKYEFAIKSARDTVHMAMNDEVASHALGSWDDCQYAVLIPFEDIPNEKIGRAKAGDTFTRGSIELSADSWILCPKNEVARLKAFNPRVHVLGYEGENVKGFSQPFLTQLGYRAEEVDGTASWKDPVSNEQFKELMEREGIEMGVHFYSYFAKDSNILYDISKAVSLSKLLRDNHLINTPRDIESIMKQLKENGQSFGSILSGLGNGPTKGENVGPESITGNKKQAEVFLEEMKKNGFNFSPMYQNIIRKICDKSILESEYRNNDDIKLNISEKVSGIERKSIEEMLDVINSDKYVDIYKREDIFNKFMSNAIGKSILYSQKREISTEKSL